MASLAPPRPPTFKQLAADLVNLPGLVRNLYGRRELIITLTWRDFRARFLGTFGGVFWAVVQPLFMMIIYTLVFSTFLGVRFGNTDSPFTFAVYLLCGMLPWTAFNEGFGASTGIIRSNVNLVRRVVFPLEVLPLSQALVGAIQQVIGFVLLIPLAWVVSGRLYLTVFLFPFLMLPQLLLSVGLFWFWTSLSVFLPDLRQFTALLLQMLIFLTPIFYPLSAIPAQFLPVIALNPYTTLVSMYRQIFMEGVLPDPGTYLGFTLVSLVFFMAGYFWFMRTKKGFPDVL